jgi:oxaloacetate decarboxylase gamma subunit
MDISVWMLLVVGLGTVFCALLLIIGMGNLLISVVNRFFPEEEPKAQTATAVAAVAPNIKAAIESAVSTITGGKGKVESIEKI